MCVHVHYTHTDTHTHTHTHTPSLRTQRHAAAGNSWIVGRPGIESVIQWSIGVFKEIEKVSEKAVEYKGLIAVPNCGPIDGRGRVQEAEKLEQRCDERHKAYEAHVMGTLFSTCTTIGG